MKYINQEIFVVTFGFFFSFPTAIDIFLEYIAPSIESSTTNSVIPFGIGIITILVFLMAWVGLYDLIKKYYSMRGIMTGNHSRNIWIAIILGVFCGLIAKGIIF